METIKKLGLEKVKERVMSVPYDELHEYYKGVRDVINFLMATEETTGDLMLIEDLMTGKLVED